MESLHPVEVQNPGSAPSCEGVHAAVPLVKDAALWHCLERFCGFDFEMQASSSGCHARSQYTDVAKDLGSKAVTGWGSGTEGVRFSVGLGLRGFGLSFRGCGAVGSKSRLAFRTV